MRCKINGLIVACISVVGCVVIGFLFFGRAGSSDSRPDLICLDEPKFVQGYEVSPRKKLFFPLQKVEVEESILNRMYASAQRKESQGRWLRIADVGKEADIYEMVNKLNLSTTIPIWRFPNVWTDDEAFFYVWYSEEPFGYCIDKKTLTYGIWSFDSPPVFTGKEKPVLSRFSHLKPKHFRTPEKQEAKALDD